MLKFNVGQRVWYWDLWQKVEMATVVDIEEDEKDVSYYIKKDKRRQEIICGEEEIFATKADLLDAICKEILKTQVFYHKVEAMPETGVKVAPVGEKK